MITTRASVERFIDGKGYDETQVQGIPDGFAFKKPDVTIGGVLHKGEYIVFMPLSEEVSMRAKDITTLKGIFSTYERNNARSERATKGDGWYPEGN